MKKKILGLILIATMVVFSGCCKANKKVITGLDKVLVGTYKIEHSNNDLVKQKIYKIKQEIKNAETEEDKIFWSKVLQNYESLYRANQRLPEAIRELLKTLRNE